MDVFSAVLEHGPTAVDAVDVVGAVGPQCCQRSRCCDIWKLLAALLALLFSIGEMVVGFVVLEEFKPKTDNKLIEFEVAQTLGYSFLPIVYLSAVIHGSFVLCHRWPKSRITKCCVSCVCLPIPDDSQRNETVEKRLFDWRSVNSLGLMICEFIVSVSKIAIAFESQEAKDLLRTLPGIIASSITFTVVTVDLLVTLIFFIRTLRMRMKCTRMLCWNLILFVSSLVDFSVALVSLLISASVV